MDGLDSVAVSGAYWEWNPSNPLRRHFCLDSGARGHRVGRRLGIVRLLNELHLELNAKAPTGQRPIAIFTPGPVAEGQEASHEEQSQVDQSRCPLGVNMY